MKPQVVYWNNLPSPYMVDRFNAVAERGNLEFEAWFSARIGSGRSWDVVEGSWKFPYRFLPSRGGGEHPLAFPAPLLGRDLPDLLVSLYASTAFLSGWALARARGIRTAFWAEITFEAWTPRRRWKETIKSNVLKRADGILTAGRDGSDYVRRYGVLPERIFVVPHVIDFEYFSLQSAISDDERARIRGDLGLRGTTFVYVGRFWWGKGLSYLLDAFSTLQRSEQSEVSLMLVGDGPDEKELRDRCRVEGIRNVVFPGFHQANMLPKLYAAADVFVFPTLGDPFGMVVPEAMACGLPVVSTSAAGELRDRVSDGVNGFVVPPADAAALLEPMRRLARDGELRASMVDAAVEKVRGQSPTVWAEAFEHAVAQILAR